jgi:hypothetical protein
MNANPDSISAVLHRLIALPRTDMIAWTASLELA